MIYIVLLFLYWAIGVYAIVKCWTKTLDLYLSFFIYILLICWAIWPFIVLLDGDNIIVFKKRGE